MPQAKSAKTIFFCTVECSSNYLELGIPSSALHFHA